MVSQSTHISRAQLTPIQPPKASNQKRKRGRPPGASKVAHDASSNEAPVANDEPDAEEQARPRKRGRKAKTDQNSNTSAGPAAQDDPAQPPRRGRPSKTSQQEAAARDTEALPGRQGKEAERRAKDEVNKNIGKPQGKRKAAQEHDAQADEATSSEPRRGGRERRSWNPDEIFGSNRPISPKQGVPNRGPNRVPRATTDATKNNAEVAKGRAGQSNKSQAEDESPSSNPRRSARERGVRDPDATFGGGRQGDRQEVANPTQVTEKAKPQEGTNALPKGGAVSKTLKPRRGRPPLSNGDSGEGRALQPQQGNRTKAPGKASKKAQPSIVAGSGGEGSQPKRRGRPMASDSASQASEQDQFSEARARVRGRPAKPRQDQDGAPAQPKSKPKKSQPRQLEAVPEETESSGAEEEEESELPFRHLRESPRNIPRSTISKKWNPLDGPSINAVGAFLADAQRPVLLRLQDTGRRREHASSALSTVSRRLRSKLVKGFPFPAPTAGAPTRAGSGSYEDEFNFERTVDAIQALEGTLNPLQHSVGLLEREIKREEDALARDYDYLHKLEVNARSEAKGWREQARREHVLAPGIKKRGDESGNDDGWIRDSLELVPRAQDDDGDNAPGGLFGDLQDSELATLSKQVASHMESMKGNLQQIGGVVPAITKSKAALQQVLLKHLGDEQYERILIG